MQLNTIEELIEDIRHGKMVILMDDEDRENEGDLVIASTMVRPEDINFMIKQARGLVCLTMTRERCQQLNLPLMVSGPNGSQFGTNFTLSIEATEGVTTGISAGDRARTVQAAVARDAKPSDIVQPGHIFPIMAQPGGVLRRAGHTEAGCDLARLAGLEASSVIVEIINEDGTMARRPDLEAFAQEHGLKIGTIADLIHYRTVNERTVEKLRTEKFPTQYGEFNLTLFRDLIDGQVHLALVKGDVSQVEAPYVRVHVADPLRDLLLSIKENSSGWNLQKSLRFLGKSDDPGVILLLGDSFEKHNVEELVDSFTTGRQPARQTTGDGTGIYRTIGTGSQILRDLGLSKMRLLSSPMRFNALSGFDLEIVEYVDSDI
ncbi:3,4-dihydroxy-2-butanone-4-phosphate synthase [Ketobacter sp. MCCC 1A13808]|uniref:bifunctional 3,4-dihydroxy-2-butanone-4-phosphate synthase/GTP cyclohydrolase II n=1 Tax=Ketobacter sp. MCCC 1A13808 TaxID=2602738 RepID=UPI000F1BCD7E|nr:bifunctional 3,4-dihydroxy-2-butanone-4-phosphate synthase/GTP cyclohydrolase II [Ketobacter sp. MCCC 1A13808]MVF11414.1 3,4-dihydroxy-2-butanone-4-phosphate synthase [Ketobacter sp. MCCC 1A13808]RLP54647.1 MAG: 3,4-dihydroxy-2-butanone-4-phosphate synthase [Ketobacter sp.]